MSAELLSLGRLYAARLCHDLGGLAGTLAGALDLANAVDPGVEDLLGETAQVLRGRLRLYATAWGGAEVDLDAVRLGELLRGAPAVPRVSFDLEAVPADAVWPAEVVPLMLNAALLGTEALPRGGVVRIGGAPEMGMTILPEGRGANWPPLLMQALAADDAAALLRTCAPRFLLPPLVVLMAAEIGWTVSLALGSPTAPGVAPLLLLAPQIGA
jgi:histidine phosphotransferase ChpT